MVGFGQGLGCGCCGDVCGLNEEDNAPDSTRIFLPASLLPHTEPFNNLGPSHPSFGVVPLEGGMTWNEATAGDKLNPSIGSNISSPWPPATGGDAEYEPFRYRASVNTHVYTRATATRLKASGNALIYKMTDNFFFTGFQLVISGLVSGSSYSTMARLVTQARQGLSGFIFYNGYGRVGIYAPESQGSFAQDAGTTLPSSLSRDFSIEFFENGANCEIRFKYNGVTATVLKPSGTLSEKCAVRIAVTAYGFSRFSFYPPSPRSTYIDNLVIDADI